MSKEHPNFNSCIAGLAFVLFACVAGGLFVCSARVAAPQINDLKRTAPQDHNSEKIAVKAVQPLSEVSKGDVPQPVEPKPVPLVEPSDEIWLAALREKEGADPWKVTVEVIGGPSKGEYQIQEGRWNDALDRLGIDHDDHGWRWDLWYWNRAKAEYVLYSYWARFKLKTWEQRIKAHKGLAGINNPSRKVYYERVKNIAWDLMNRKDGG